MDSRNNHAEVDSCSASTTARMLYSVLELRVDYFCSGCKRARDRQIGSMDFQEQDWFSDKNKKLNMQMCREIVRMEAGDESAEMWYNHMCANLGIDA